MSIYSKIHGKDYELVCIYWFEINMNISLYNLTKNMNTC